MSTRTRTRWGAAGLAAVAAASLVLPGTAQADPAPTANDVVGLGSDLIQYAVDFGADGSLANSGYNSAGNINRIASFDAYGDANGRDGYLDGTSTSISSTVVIRGGSSPIQRPNGGTTGLNAFLADTAKKISFVRVPRVPTQAEQTRATNNGWSGIHVVQIADDSQKIGVANTTNAPAGLSAAVLVKIYNGTYKHWNEIPGNSGGSTNAIIPLIPQAGGTVRSIFDKTLAAANGGTAVQYDASVVVTVKQNDPTVVNQTDSPADAIVPLPVGRLALYNSGYFKDPFTPYPNAASVNPGVKLLTGSSPDGAASYAAALPYYIWLRQSDVNSTTPWQPGGTKNWAKTLFVGATSYFAAAGQSAIQDSGATPNYSDLGTPGT